ncbi:hypothetical protein [Allohahella marinimesophila]|uniref:DUF1795 domain-containing protein n=1 Tax=Allohahella marinimesophila TaxID=1054972 RepID=A0ABP7PHC2_9GAMM
MKTFDNAPLQFSIGVPEGWILLPGAWAKKLKMSAASTSDSFAQTLGKSSEPLLSMYLPQVNPQAAVPIVQCTVKPVSIMSAFPSLDAVIEATIPQLQGAFPDFELLDRLGMMLFAGVRSAYMRSAMTVLNERHERFLCMSELFICQSSKAIFMFGFTGSLDPELRPLDDFAAVKRSIRLH